jgi:pimeloyl-ACP methyl ester carboxylesterase
MPTRDIPIDIPVDGHHIAGTLVGPDTMVPGVMLVHGWDGSQNQYIARAHEIAALGCICLTIDLRGHVRHQGLRESVTAKTISGRARFVRRAGGPPGGGPGAIAIVGSSYGGISGRGRHCASAGTLACSARASALQDSDWDTPKGKLNRDELNVFRQTVVPSEGIARLPPARRFAATC